MKTVIVQPVTAHDRLILSYQVADKPSAGRQFINSTSRLNRYRRPVLVHENASKTIEESFRGTTSMAVGMNHIFNRYLNCLFIDQYDGLEYFYDRKKDGRKYRAKARKKSRKDWKQHLDQDRLALRQIKAA